MFGGGGSGHSCHGKHEQSKETLMILSIVSLASGVFCLVVIIFLLATITYDTGDVCNNILSVSVGEQPQCRVFSSDADAFVHGENVTAYQYDIIDSSKLEKEIRTTSFVYEETVGPNYYASFTSSYITGITDGFNALSVHYNMSSPATVYVLDDINYEIFVHEKEVRFFIVEKENVTDWEYSYNGTIGIHIVVKNDKTSPIVITEEGWVQKMMYKMDANLALSICQPGQQCRINNTKSSVFILDYNGVERTVPMTMLYNYGFDTITIPPLIYMVLITVGMLVLAGLLFCASRRAKSRKELQSLKYTQLATESNDEEL